MTEQQATALIAAIERVAEAIEMQNAMQLAANQLASSAFQSLGIGGEDE